MNRFSGFPSRPEYVAIPKVFFSDVLPFIEDQAELVASLHFFRLLGQKRGYPRAVSIQELAPEHHRGVELALARGTFLQATTPRGEAWVLLNTAGDKRAAAAIETGQLHPGAGKMPAIPAVALPAPDIFTQYEQTVGVLTPLIAEILQEAEREYPKEWVEEAFRIAEAQNQRRWRYVERILQRWKAEGKDDGKPGRYSKAGRVADYSTWFPAGRKPS